VKTLFLSRKEIASFGARRAARSHVQFARADNRGRGGRGCACKKRFDLNADRSESTKDAEEAVTHEGLSAQRPSGGRDLEKKSRCGRSACGSRFFHRRTKEEGRENQRDHFYVGKALRGQRPAEADKGLVSALMGTPRSKTRCSARKNGCVERPIYKYRRG